MKRSWQGLHSQTHADGELLDPATWFFWKGGSAVPQTKHGPHMLPMMHQHNGSVKSGWVTSREPD